MVHVCVSVIEPVVNGFGKAGVIEPEPKFPVQEYGIIPSASPVWLHVTCEVWPELTVLGENEAEHVGSGSAGFTVTLHCEVLGLTAESVTVTVYGDPAAEE